MFRLHKTKEIIPMTKSSLILFFLIGFIASGCNTTSPSFIPYDSPSITYEGRIDTTSSDRAELYWSGTSISLNFEGTGISAKMKEERGDNYYNVIIDGELSGMIRPDTSLSEYVLASELPDGPHMVELLKRTEYDRGYSWFYGFRLDEGSKALPPSPEKTRKIEYFGDSITAGYSTNDYNGDRSDSIYTNYYESYGNLIAEHFNADQHCTCKSGIGITISWFPTIMPDVWNNTDPLDSTSTWDFNQYQPDLVIVNLFQNDSWLVNMPDHPSFKHFFGTIKPTKDELIGAYAGFLKNVRSVYPDAAIITTLGNMDITREGSEWPDYVVEAVESLNDDRIYYKFTPFKNTPGHPKAEEQVMIAENLIPFIEEKMGW